MHAILFWLFAAGLFLLQGSAAVGASLKGSAASMELQNTVADDEGLTRIEDDEQLERFKKRRQLVPVPVGPGVKLRPGLEEKYAWTRPWTADLLRDLGREFNHKFRDFF